MKTMARSVLLALLACMLSACGTLNVTMGVLRPEVVRAEIDRQLVATLLPTVLASNSDSIDLDVGRLKKAHLAVYVRLRHQYETHAATLAEPGKSGLNAISAALTANFDTNTAELYGSLGADLKKYRASMNAIANGSYTIAPEDARYRATVDILRVWQKRVAQSASIIQGDIAKKVKDAYSTIAANSVGALSIPDLKAYVAAERETVAAANSSVEQELSQLSVQNSPAAFAVANAVDKDWAERYNFVDSESYGGAADVAIKLDPKTGNYLLKGLSFDPSDVAAVASKVTTQALLVSAQMMGVPVKSTTTPAAGASGAALATSSGALADAQASMESRRAQDDARKAALIGLANIILNEESDFKSTDPASRKAAVAAIKSAFETRLTILRSTPTP